MNDSNYSVWSVMWSILFFGTLAGLFTLLSEEKTNDGAIGGVLILLLLELSLLSIPSLWENWQRGAPARQRARATRQERAADQARLRAEQEEARRDRQADKARQREEKVALARAQKETAAARNEVESFYAQHADLLQEVLPPALFTANIAAAFPPGIASAQAWEVARDLIAEMQPLLQQQRTRRRELKAKEQSRRKDVRAKDDEIRKCEKEIARLQAVGKPDDGFSDEEIRALRGTIAKLREERSELLIAEES